ncbi:hypothetical protein, partial [Streptomyces cinereoruber]|uniref:hypothetical protein n=1 Tax=Streptomyces cinereoruber TaxID=67260 RepID=UPI0036283DDF
ACTFNQAEQANLTSFARSRVDGLGRPLSTRVYAIGDTARSATGGTEVAKATYNDTAASLTPGAAVTVVTEKAAGDGQFSRTETQFDGLGRAVKQSVRLNDAGTDRVTSYDYNASGLVRDILAPRGDGVSGTVTMRTAYDPLGRPLTTSEVGGATLIQHAYDGLTHTLQQTVPAAGSGTVDDGSERSLARTTTDAAGQVVKIEERSGGTLAAPVFAATTYRYDGAGRTSKMTDPDGAVTTMTHDYTGNRLSITSENDTSTTADNRTWTYAYDGNNQMLSTTEPVPAGKTAAEFTHSTEYDDLGRVVREKPATRGMTNAQLDELKIGERTHTYDIAHSSLPRLSGKANFQVGKLAYTTTKDRNASTVIQTVNRYDNNGHLTSASQDVPGLAGLIPGLDKLQADTTIDPAGITESSELRAFDTGGVQTFIGVKTDVDYDRDGTPQQVSFALGGKNMTIRHDRNTAGLISKRVTNTQNTSGFGAPTVDFGHDKYGRITSLTAKIGATQRYKQTLGYLQNDEIGHITEQLGGTAEGTLTTTYTYDPRKQLKTAVQSASTTPAAGTKGYIGLNTSYTYTPGGRIGSAAVASAQPG